MKQVKIDFVALDYYLELTSIQNKKLRKNKRK